MKVNYNAWRAQITAPPIPLSVKKDEVDPQDKNSYLTVELRYSPADPDSRVYKKNVRYFKGGTPKQYIDFRADVEKVITGQSITMGPAQFAMVRTLLRGDALRVFNNRATAQGAETVANLTLVLNSVGEHVFPKKPLAKQKRYMRRFIKKPQEMTSREFLACLSEMNEDLQHIPPYAADQSLEEDEMLEIAEFALPVKWQKCMVEHGFDCSTKTLDEVIEFAERQETIESLEADPPAKKAKKATEKDTQKTKGGLPGRAKSSEEANSNRKSKGYCRLHGPGHPTHDCKVLKDQADRMRSTQAAQHHSTYNRVKGKRPYGNTYNKEEVNKIVAASNKKAVAKAMAKAKSCDSDEERANRFKSLSLSDDDSVGSFQKL